MKITSITWGSDVSLLAEACAELGMEISAWSARDLEDEEKRRRCTRSFEHADVIILRPTNDVVWDDVIEKLDPDVPIISFGYDPAFWQLSNVSLKITATVNAYYVHGGLTNIKNMLRYIGKEVLGLDYVYDPPEDVMWQGVYHPDADRTFDELEDYLQWYKPKESKNTVGILFNRRYWENKDLEIVNSLIRELEKEYSTIPVFCHGIGDIELGSRPDREVIEEFLMGRIDALINLQSVFNLGDDDSGSVDVLKKLDVPVFHPLMSYHATEEEWSADVLGLSSTEIGWSVAMPEFEGVIEPIIIGVATSGEEYGTEFERHTIIEDRVRKVVNRIRKWITLKEKPQQKRKVAFILHNNPCASLEATIGAGAHLDTLESVARILNCMKEGGYSVNPPGSGKELIDTIMDRKAIAEFRWTTIEEIVAKGGVLAMVTKAEYEEWFGTLASDVRARMCEVWGNPPGEAKDGVPAAMVYDGKIIVTGVTYGNAVVCIQPKRGCAGSRCDGEVCKILHDPEIPPPHQYMATYRYLENEFGADVIVHVGTHGNLEFLPGKSVALSERCYPDLAIGNIPHLYIYNSDNPPEGTIAKRRSYATLIDHAQTVMTESGLYGELKELEDQIAEYNKTKEIDKGRAHATEHVIKDLLFSTKLDSEIQLEKLVEEGVTFERIVDLAHEAITRIYNSQIPDGMHIFGETPKGDRKVELINSILRYDSELRKAVFDLMGMDIEISDAPSDVLSDADALGKELIREFVAMPIQNQTGNLNAESAENVQDNKNSRVPLAFSAVNLSPKNTNLDHKAPKRERLSDPEILEKVFGDRLKNINESTISPVRDKIFDISSAIDASDELGALLHGFDAGYIEPGPSGLITRGKPEILPTGRNFYSLDPFKIPTKAAWRIGERLSDGVIRKYEEEHGRIPENIAMYWMASDIMWADGEQLAQILHLIGAEPIWDGSQVNGYKIIPLEELGRPRIDVTIRVSGITRDCFYNCVEFLDEAIREISLLDEPDDLNYIKKHTSNGAEAEAVDVDGAGTETGTGTIGSGGARIFSSKPGTYGNGVNLAVYASAWKEDKDLSDVYMYWNGYEYGKGVFGAESHDKFASQLRTVDLTFNKTVTDEYDLCGCCCYFGTHGGLTTAAREVSGNEVSAYYGDTRDVNRVEVRTLADEMRRVVRTKLLNPKWIEGMKNHGYKGAGDISKRIGRVYGWEATTQEVDDWIFDDITKTFVLDDEMRQFFEANNPYALEEIGRRLLEAAERGLWDADPEVLDGLKSAYLEMEGWIEERMGDVKGDFQGGSIDVVTAEEVAGWKAKMGAVLGEV